MFEPDLKDKKILFELDFDAKQSYSELAKKVGLSKQVVEYRVKNLEKKGIVKGYYAVVNAQKLGYLYCRVSLVLQNISPEELKELYEDLRRDPRTFWVFEVQGTLDVFFGSWSKNLTEFRKLVNDVMTKHGKFVKIKVENVATNVIHYQHRYLLKKKETLEIHIKETEERVEIDEKDRKILTILCNNARTPLIDIASQIKESAKTIAYRIRRMEKQKLIEAYRTIIDHTKLGFTYYKIFLNISNYTNQDVLRLREFIKNHTATIYYVEGIGLHADIDFEMMIKDNQELFDFIKVLRKEFPKIVGNYTTVIFMDTLKVKYLPF
jgi:Lrp/AsnC family transcriptional regulator, leucine-responsive regulatory protein